MGFIALRCPSCGANIELDSTRDFGFCSYCGTKIVQDKHVIEHRGSISIDHTAEANNLLIRANTLFDQGRISEAQLYYTRALEMDATNIEAQKGLYKSECTITEPNVFIRRIRTRYGTGLRMKIKLNGQKIPSLRDDESTELMLPVGQHQLQFYFTGYSKGHPITIDIKGNYTKVFLVCETAIMCSVKTDIKYK